MTSKSAVAKDPRSVGGALIHLAVAKKFTEPPTKDADKHAVATRASFNDKSHEDNDNDVLPRRRLVEASKERRHPTRDPIDATTKGTATVRIEDAILVGPQPVEVAVAFSMVCSCWLSIRYPKSKNAKDAGRNKVQHASYSG